MNDLIEIKEPKVGDNFVIHVVDTRIRPNPQQQSDLELHIRRDNIQAHLVTVNNLLGEYRARSSGVLNVAIIEGEVGNGENKDGIIKVQLPESTKAATYMREKLEKVFPADVSERDKNLIAAECVNESTVSTIFHEALHWLVDSKPGSKLHTTVEQISGIKDPQARISGLIDEGIVYAIQGVYAPDIKYVGNTAPNPKDDKDPDVITRKTLGIRLRNKVADYINQNKSIDDEFLKFTYDQLQKVLASQEVPLRGKLLQPAKKPV